MSNLTMQMRGYLARGDLESVVDKALNGDYNTNSMWMVAELAMACVEPRARHRPTISEVVVELESAQKEEGKALSFTTSSAKSSPFGPQWSERGSETSANHEHWKL
jgi:hypothetical protein